MSTDYRIRWVAILALVYFGIHVIFGVINCYDKFCPGDSENEWIYEYTDHEGKKFIVVDGDHIPAWLYAETKKNIKERTEQ